MRLAIMQPYFFPYIGYYQLIKAVDKFVIYDNVEYTKKGWINRNRLFFNGKIEYITLNLKRSSDFSLISEKEISYLFFDKERLKMLKKIKYNYNNAPFFNEIFKLLNDILNNNETNLFKFLNNALIKTNEYLDIKTEIIVSSKLDIDKSLKREEKVKEICNHLGAMIYINPIGGLQLYSKEEFKKNNIELLFLKTNRIVYDQLRFEFIPNLSIIDVMMFNSPAVINDYLKDFTLQ